MTDYYQALGWGLVRTTLAGCRSCCASPSSAPLPRGSRAGGRWWRFVRSTSHVSDRWRESRVMDKVTK